MVLSGQTATVAWEAGERDGLMLTVSNSVGSYIAHLPGTATNHTVIDAVGTNTLWLTATNKGGLLSKPATVRWVTTSNEVVTVTLGETPSLTQKLTPIKDVLSITNPTGTKLYGLLIGKTNVAGWRELP
jgi:hypothetical protein